MKKLIPLFAVFLLAANLVQAQCGTCNTTVSSNNSSSRSVGSNSTLCFTGGTYTGAITSIASTGRICVGPSAVFSPSSISNFSGTIEVFGTANIPAINTSAGARIINNGTVNFTNGINFNGSTTITNNANRTMNFANAVSLNNNSSITNNGTLVFAGDLTVPTGNSFVNNFITRARNTVSTSGTFTNSGLLTVTNSFAIGAGGSFTNNCRLVAASFVNAATNSINNGLIWAAGASGSVQLNGGTFNQGSNGETRGVNFSNSGSVTGSGRYHFSGTTSNSNSFGNDGGGINFFDVAVSGGGAKKFDTENTVPHASVIRSAFTPSDTISSSSPLCSSTYCPSLTANAGPDQSRCNGSTSFTMSANTASGATGFWTLVSGTATISTPSSATSSVTVAVGSTATLRWNLTNSCRSSSDDVVLTNNSNPTASISGTNAICAGGSSTFTASGGGTYAWSTGATTAAITVSTAGTYTVTVTNNGCTATASRTLTVNTAPTAAISGNQTVCSSGSSTFTASGGGTYAWSTGATTSAILVSSTGTYVVTVTSSNGCTATASRTFTVSTTPTTANAGSNQSQCGNGTFTMAANAPSSGTGAWSVVSGTATITNAASPTTTVTGIAAGATATLRWTISNAPCAASTSNVTLTNNTPPTTANAGLNQSRCGGGSTFTLAANTPTSGTGSWSVVSGTANILNVNSPTSTVQVLSGRTAVLRWSISRAGCSASTSDVTIANLYAPPAANAGADQTNCNNSSFTLNANNANLVVVTNTTIASTGLNGTATAQAYGGTPPYTYTWSNGATTSSLSNLETGTYGLTVSDAAGNNVVRQLQIVGLDNAIKRGSFLVNLGASSQTYNNAMRPYGLVYDLVNNFNVPVKWVINPNKAKDGEDFNHNGISYRGSSFVVPAEFRTARVDSVINVWIGRGVVGSTSIQDLVLPISQVITSYPTMVVDQANEALVLPIFTNAGIPSSIYRVGLPSDLTSCDDMYALPHADPTWATHNFLHTFNNQGGYIWSGCHAVSVFEGLFNPSNTSQRMNFLSTTGLQCYSSGKCGTSVTQTHASSPTTPFTYNTSANAHPIMQFIGDMTPATASGSEQWYIPQTTGAWRNGVVRAITTNNGSVGREGVKLVFGYGFSDTTKGMVMYEPGHNITSTGTVAAMVAAQRAFLNFTLLAGNNKKIDLSHNITENYIAGSTNNVSVIPSGGTSPYTYSWSSTGEIFLSATNTASINITVPEFAAGTKCFLTCVVSDACGRKNFISVPINSINLPPDPNDLLVNGRWRVVSGSATISDTTKSNATAVVSSGVTARLEWRISSGACGATFDTVTLRNVTPPTVTASSIVNPSCSGVANGSILISVTGGNSPYTYAWSNGATTQNISSLEENIYKVTVTDALGCTRVGTFTLTNQAGMNINATTTQSSCGLCTDGAISLTITNGTSPYTFAWSDGSNTSQNRTGLLAGAYTVTVTDNNGCSKISTINIYPPLAVNIAGLSNCNVQNGSATANPVGGKSPYTYIWSTGATSKSITGLASGNYTVTVRDALNATATQTVAISNTMVNIGFSPAAPEICRGSSVQVTASGALSYTWSPATGLSATNVANPTANPLTTTTYTVSTIASTSELVTNGNFSLGNTGFTSAYGYISPAANAATNGGNKGLYPEGRYAVDMDAKTYHNNFTGLGNGGSGNFMIVNGATIVGQAVWSQTISVLPNTNYNFSTFISSVNEENPANLRFQINGVVLGPNIVPSTTRGLWSQFSATWNSGSNTTAEIAIINDNTVAGGNDFGLDDISFRSTCVSTSQVTITVNQPPTANVSQTNITCNGLTNGIATVSGAVGTSPYTYIWSNGSTATSNSNLATGTYTVTVRDSKTCTGTGFVTITQPTVLNATATGTNVTCFGAANGSIVLAPSGGTAPYSYTWSNGSTVQNPTNLAPGTYTVTVRDANNCTRTASATITQPSAALASELNVTNATCNGSSTGAIAQTVSGGTSPYTYLWSTGATTQNISSRPAGSYSVTVTDSRGCTLVRISTITEPAPTTTANAGSDITNCNNLVFTLAGNIPIVGTGAWSVVNGIAVVTTPSSPTSLVTIVGNSATLRWTISNGACGSNSDDVVLSNTTTVVTANAGADITRANGSTTFAMNANAPTAPATGLWTLLSGNATIANPTSRTTNVIVEVENEASLEWRVTNGGCVARDTILIRHIPIYSGCVAINNTEWNVPTTWAGNCTGLGGYPSINDTAIISGKTVTVSGNSACKLLLMNNESGTASLNIQSTGQLTVATNIELNASAQNTVRIDLTGNADLLIGGTILRNPSPMNFGRITSNSNSTITFNGVSLQTIPTSRGRGNDAIQYQNIVFNNSSGLSPAFVAEGRVDVSNSITLTKGCIDMGRDTLMLTNNSSSAVTGGNDSSYVMGQFCRYIGQNGQTYRWSVGRKGKQGEYWFELKNNLLVGTSYVCVEFDSVPEDSRAGINYADQDITATQLAEEGIWRVEPDAQPLLGSYDVNVSIANFNGLIDNSFGLLKRPTRSAVTNWGKGGGMLPPLGGPLRAVGNRFTALGALTSFSEFGVGQGGGSALPVKLTVFEAKPIDNKFIKLKWVTETEIDNMGFEVHRSTDGQDFKTIGWVDGNGNTTETKVYNYDDKSVDPNIRYYYRLKQIDFDAKFEYSPLASAEVRNQGGVLEIGEFTPNPARGTTAISINTENDMDGEFVFYDMMGKVAKKGTVSMTKGSHLYYFDISELSSGNYIVGVITPGTKHSKRLVVY